MSAHSPAPWAIKKDGGKHSDQLVIVDSSDYTVCGTLGHFSRRECLANAKLVAASPDLLEACIGLLALVQTHLPNNSAEVHAAIAAISKTE